MDRRKRDYYVVFFGKTSGLFQRVDDVPFRDTFCISNQKELFGCHAVKVRWYSLNRKCYALLSIKKMFTPSVIQHLKKTEGVKQYIKYTPEKEKWIQAASQSVKNFRNRISRVQQEIDIYHKAIKRIETDMMNVITETEKHE